MLNYIWFSEKYFVPLFLQRSHKQTIMWYSDYEPKEQILHQVTENLATL
jgi:hypothetical protein